MIALSIEQAVKACLRKRKQATTEQIFESIREAYPDSSKYRVQSILKKSDFATSQVKENEVKRKSGVYRRMMPVWVYKPIRKRKKARNKHKITQSPEERSMDMNVIWPRLVYQSRLRDELKRIREELNNTDTLKAVNYKVWIEQNPEQKRRLIGNNEQYEAIQDFITVLDARNDYQRDKMVVDERYKELTDQCLRAYEVMAGTSFLGKVFSSDQRNLNASQVEKDSTTPYIHVALPSGYSPRMVDISFPLDRSVDELILKVQQEHALPSDTWYLSIGPKVLGPESYNTSLQTSGIQSNQVVYLTNNPHGAPESEYRCPRCGTKTISLVNPLTPSRTLWSCLQCNSMGSRD